MFTYKNNNGWAFSNFFTLLVDEVEKRLDDNDQARIYCHMEFEGRVFAATMIFSNFLNICSKSPKMTSTKGEVFSDSTPPPFPTKAKYTPLYNIWQMPPHIQAPKMSRHRSHMKAK